MPVARRVYISLRITRDTAATFGQRLIIQGETGTDQVRRRRGHLFLRKGIH